MKHIEAHPLAGQTVVIATGKYRGEQYHVEDYWDRVAGKSWMFCQGNPACLKYATRTGLQDTTPMDDEVLYGKIGGLGELIHVCELRKAPPCE